MKHNDYYAQVYGKGDPTPEGPHGWIQWKGTRVCMDLHCSCGHHGHIDSDFFFYYFECPKCHGKFAVGQHVKLIPLTPELIAMGEIGDERFVTCELENE